MSVWLWSPTFIISSFVSFSAILLAISCMKASRLSRPELSLSTWEGRLVCKKDNQELPTNLWDHFLDLFFSWFKSKSPHGNFQIFGVNHPLARRVKKAATGRCLQWRNISKKTTISPESLLDVWLLLLSEIKFGRHSLPLCTPRHVWKIWKHLT